ncbi:MAG: hypothetical protein WBA89_24845, partial [Microcoleus sp.]
MEPSLRSVSYCRIFLEKWDKEDAAKLHREARCVEVLKIRSQTEVSNAKSDLAEAKATIVKQF